MNGRPSVAEEYQKKVEVYVARRQELDKAEAELRMAQSRVDVARNVVAEAEKPLKRMVGASITNRIFIVGPLAVLVDYNGLTGDGEVSLQAVEPMA